MPYRENVFLNRPLSLTDRNKYVKIAVKRNSVIHLRVNAAFCNRASHLRSEMKWSQHKELLIQVNAAVWMGKNLHIRRVS